MMISLTNSVTRHVFGLNINVILAVEREIDNPLQTVIITSLNTGHGLQKYPIQESPEEVGEMLRQIHRGAMPQCTVSRIATS